MESKLNSNRIMWTEKRGSEIFNLIAEKGSFGWEFWERSSWEIIWYRADPTPNLMSRAAQFALGYDSEAKFSSAETPVEETASKLILDEDSACVDQAKQVVIIPAISEMLELLRTNEQYIFQLS